jgi:hypothetical protein
VHQEGEAFNRSFLRLLMRKTQVLKGDIAKRNADRASRWLRSSISQSGENVPFPKRGKLQHGQLACVFRIGKPWNVIQFNPVGELSRSFSRFFKNINGLKQTKNKTTKQRINAKGRQ